MKVTRNAQGNINVELESPEEVTTLWAVAASISGALSTPRSFFSNNDPKNLGLCQRLSPYVAATNVARERYGVTANNPPPHTQDTLVRLFGVILNGDLAFTEMPADSSQEKSPSFWSA